MRQDETDVNFVDIKPADADEAARTLRSELEANRRAWERIIWVIDYVESHYPKDEELKEALGTVRHHLEQRI